MDKDKLTARISSREVAIRTVTKAIDADSVPRCAL